MIDPSDKIIRFRDIESLKDAIRKDMDSGGVLEQRYCVRFIMLNNFDVFRNLTKFLAKELKVEMFELQQLIPAADKTITIDKLIDAIKGITKSSLVTPFSELVRFYNERDFKGFFNEIILTESIKDPKKRIYIPIIGLHNRFNDFLKDFGRIEESAPIWQLYTPVDDKVKVFVSKYKSPELPDTSEYCKLDTMKDWLEFWKKQAPREKILCSARPINSFWENSRPDSIFTFSEINNVHEFIADYLGIDIPFQYNEAEDSLWERLLDAICEDNHTSFNWKQYVERHFNILKFGFKEIMEIWAEERSSAYDRWLLKNYLLNTDQLKSKPYTRLCIEETYDLNIPAALFVKAAERIFYAITPAEREKFAPERKSLMHQERNLFRRMVPKENQDWLLKQIIEMAQNDKDLISVKSLCAGTFDFEKLLYIGWYDQRNEKIFGIKDLQEHYPDLYAYLTPKDNSFYKAGAEWVGEYFAAYRESKVKDKRLTRIINFIKKHNADEKTFWDWYYKHFKAHDLYNEMMEDEMRRPDKTYWIDGLGAEFIPFIQYLIETSKSNYEIIEIEVAATGLPSNTSLNRFDGEEVIKFGELDALAHSAPYKKWESLISELEVIRDMIGKILQDNSVGNHTIAIVSDHGLSAISRLAEPLKQTGKSHHEGRYIPYEATSDHDSMPEYIAVTNSVDGKKYKVALTHSSLGKKPCHEVHGGCTPEEVLVPFIVISNIDSAKPVPYKIQVSKAEIPISDPVFECVINPQPKSAKLVIRNQKIEMKKSGTIWKASIPNPVEGKMSVGVLPLRGKLTSFDIDIYGLGMGGSIEDDFDI